MTQIKICGLTRREDIEQANALQLDYVGFVFAKSRRQVTAEQARQLKAQLAKTIQAVGVFVNAPLEVIDALLAEGLIDVVQLHGQETNAYMQAFRARHPNVPLIKAVNVRSMQDILQWQYAVADYLLLDNGAGGTGQPFDWNLLSALPHDAKPYFIAGGLAPQTVGNVLPFAPYGVDVSSGVETDGYKDPEKMKKFVKEVRT